jgi:hypothetical protein
MRLYRQLLVAALVVAWSLVGGVGGRSWAAEKGSKSVAGVESSVIPSGVSGGKDSVKGKGSGKDSEKVRSVAAQDGGKVAGGGTVGAGGVAFFYFLGEAAVKLVEFLKAWLTGG